MNLVKDVKVNMKKEEQEKRLISPAEREKILDRAAEYLKIGMENILEFAKLYYNSVDKVPSMHESFCKRFPNVSESSWKRFKLVAQKKASPYLAVNYVPEERTIMRLPVEKQDLLLSKPVELVVFKDSGETDIIKAEYKEMTPAQRRQVIDYDSIRTTSQQRLYLENIRTAEKVFKKNGTAKKSYYVKSNKFICHLVDGCKEFTKDEIIDILRDLK